MLARKFLYIVAGLIVLTLGASIAYRLWGQQLMAAVMVPRAQFVAPPPVTAERYGHPDMWLARPDMAKDNPALWLPDNAWRPAVAGKAAVFFVHPTSYMAPATKALWNDPLNNTESHAMARGYIAFQASAFSAAGKVWAPRYHQAHVGAFMADSDKATKAMDAAYRDIEAAFAVFQSANPDGPIILAGHSQGSMLLMRLMRDHVANTPIASRIAAAYIIGWPVSVSADLPALGLPACSGPDQAGCILSWQTFAEPSDVSAIIQGYGRYPGMTGARRAGTPMLCTNPLTGNAGDSASPDRNLGTLVPPDRIGTKASLVPRAVSARCATEGPAKGFLLIGDAPDMGPYVLPGNNYHFYDYALFWANIRLDASKRLTAFLSR